MIYEDLIGVMTDEQIQNQMIWFDNFKIQNTNQKWLACAYIYAKNNKLKEYQARSFASELTLFLTGEMFNTDSDIIYKEDWLDSHLCKKYKEILADMDNEKDDLFWARFIAYLRCFYAHPLSWKYERVTHQINIKVSDYEYEKFIEVDEEKNIDKFIKILTSYDPAESVDFVRDETTRQIVFKVGESVYDLFMTVPYRKKSQKFCACLYQYIESQD